MNGRIVKALSGFYYVEADGQIYECKARGNFRNSGVSPLVGDWASVELTDSSHGVLTEIFDRKNFLNRPPVANLDKLLLVSSYEKPAPNFYLLDKFTAAAVYRKVEPIVIFNKCDLGNCSSWHQRYAHVGFQTFTVSAHTGEGLESLTAALSGGVFALTGNSGVGKSSLLNALFPDLSLKTGEISEKLGRGRHTTRHTQLFQVKEDTFVADTPGFSSFEGDMDYEFKENLIHCFPDLAAFSDHCRFTSCTHTCETGCGVIEAVKKGEIEISRHISYCQCYEELKNLRPWMKK